ncbi:MAG: polyhydroxyalkanoate synthesis repressor PhaR [Gammaproteobacteria bacterium]|nr:polyhydroxyalkanoate synthesis repressor PhaR [Gammaproteobacteria bacterium]
MSEEKKSVRIIKKYPNRRLYDTESSRYITLTEVRQLVIDEVPFIVVEKKTDEDITRSILLQIILEQESESNPLFSNDNLQRFIRYYGSTPQQGFSEFIGQSLQFFHEQQLGLGKAFEGITGQNPMSVWADMTKKNMDTWGQMMGITNPNDKSDKTK